MSQPIPVKLVMVGDGTVGKTCILLSYTQNRFPTEYVPTIFDNSTTTMKTDGKIVNLGLWDTAGQQEFARLRPLAYPNSDIFLITFSVVEKSTFTNAIKRWYDEVHKTVPNALCVFVGNKIDLRSSAGSNALSESEIRQQLKSIDCLYFECSALTRAGLKEVFQNSVREVLNRKKGVVSSNPPKPEDATCNCQLI